MNSRFLKVRQLYLAAALVTIGASPALAASCGPITPASTQSIGDFKTNPAELLATTGDLAARVAAIVSADTADSAAVMRVGKLATPEQKQAIGQGAAKAALACQTSAPLETFAIQSQVIAANDREILLSFLRGMSDVATTLAGTGGNAGGAAGGAGTGTSNGGSRQVGPSNLTGGGSSSSVGVSALVQRSNGTSRARFTTGDSQLNAFSTRSP